MTELLNLAESIAALVHDGDTVALEGSIHLVPMAAGHEIIRQGRRNLVLVRMTPDLLYDQMVGAGCARRLIFATDSNRGADGAADGGRLHRLRDAVEHSWPAPLELERHSPTGLANRYAAGAAGLPFAVLRGPVKAEPTEQIAPPTTITCPYTAEVLRAVPALNPDVAVIHAQRADRCGNVQFWGVTGVQKQAVLAARRTLVTVEEVVGKLDRRPGATVLPWWVVTAVAVVPGGARPSYAQGYYGRDHLYYREWDAISRDRKAFVRWLNRQVRAAA